MLVEVDAVVGVAPCRSLEPVEELDEAIAGIPVRLAYRLHVQVLEVAVVRGRVGQGTAQVFVGDRGEPDDPAFRRCDRVQQVLVSGDEAGQAGLAVEGVGHAVADDQHGRLRGLDLFHERAEPGLRRIEPGPRQPRDRIPAPAQVAKGQVQRGVLERQERLEVAVPLVALDQCIAHQDDPVAIPKRPGPGLFEGVLS